MGACIDSGRLRYLGDEFARRAGTDRHAFDPRLIEGSSEPARRLRARLGIEQHVEVRLSQSSQVCEAGTEWRDHVHLDAELREDFLDRAQVVPVPKAERGGPQDVAARRIAGAPRALDARRRRALRSGGAHQLIERLARAPVLFFLIGGQVERDDGDGQADRPCEAAGIVLKQFGRA